MFTYAVIATWTIGFIMGIAALAAVFVYMDGREEKRLQQERADRIARREGQRTAEQIDADEEAAVQLVQDKLGASILNYDKVN